MTLMTITLQRQLWVMVMTPMVTMLMDMTPSSGQYANLANETDTFSIFFSRSNGVSPDTLPDYE